MAKVRMEFLPVTADTYDVTLAIAATLHSDDFRAFAKDAAEPVFRSESLSARQLLLNFKVELNQSRVGTTRNDGTGTLLLPSGDVRAKFIEWIVKHKNHIKILGKKIKLFSLREVLPRAADFLSKTPYVDPNIEREHEEKVWALHEALRVDVVQFGSYHTSYPARPIPDNKPPPLRSFSVEWEREYFSTDPSSRKRSGSPGPPTGVAWLRFDYTHKLISIQLGDESTEYSGSNIIITFSSISRIAVGYDPKPYVCFDTLTPPVLEAIRFHRTLTGDAILDSKKSKIRIGSLEEGHLRVCPYAQQLRIVLYNDPNRDMIKVFSDTCTVAGLPPTIVIRFNPPYVLEASKQGFFTDKRLHKLGVQLGKLDWAVAFQIEALLHNALLHTDETDKLFPQIERMCREKGSSYTGQFLQEYTRLLRIKSRRESPFACFARVSSTFTGKLYDPAKNQAGTFSCCHVTVTPTRMILDGPYPIQSNRIIRKYQRYEQNFLRVDFRDEASLDLRHLFKLSNLDQDKLQYRWAREVDGSQFVRNRVGGILKNGLCLGGRRFEFLAYSTSALRGHAVWFQLPFRHEESGEWVTSQVIRNEIGDFAGTPLLKCPSKYAARLAQAFTATDPSVRINRAQWEEIPDLIVECHKNDDKPHSKFVFTDGVGTISSKLADMIWAELCKVRHDKGVNSLRPSAFQIRFLGFKGVVAVDTELDKHPDGILMRLRDSMKKFESDDSKSASAEIEIARAFEKPNMAYLNRPLVMALEDRGVRRDVFCKLQDIAIANARTIHDSVAQFRAVLRDHSMGNHFRLSYILDKFKDRGLDLKPKHRTPGIDNEFFHQLRQVAEMSVLRELKHSARIPIPESYLLVGIADEGVAYRNAGYDNVFVLQPGQIAVCIQGRDDKEPRWLKGSCIIARSPIVHLGDVQRVQAIGEPPKGMLCPFADSKNVVVLPCTDTERSLASCLGGGDLDVSQSAQITCDDYVIIQYSSLLPPNQESPASYPDGSTLTLDRDCVVEDICDFIVEYINSDVLGLLSDRLLVIADQSKDGMYDDACQYLAELCSQAVDYSKQGVPVDLDRTGLPPKLLRCNPDWHAAEVVSPRETDYYPSEKALGELFRAITLDKPITLISDTESNANISFDPFTDPIFAAITGEVRKRFPNCVFPDGTCTQTAVLFRTYADELRYISSTHSLTTEPGVDLLEAEIVVGTILAKCTQKRWRSDCIYRMRYHATTVIRDIQKQLFPRETDADKSEENLRASIERILNAWDFSIRHQREFAAKSFGLIALGLVFDCLEVVPL
ncbi:RNA-dependent RNA polymerase [Favolaschia claudopus]|uniref:RNA-dependent RNA polymerase n=1 Tax=Favolaschia claudopus TaxID=2862362 RepID=A0AAW0CEC2_9AGAR